jgi:hypothetical protein
VREGLDVVCVFFGTKYSVDYVYKLQDAVTRNLVIPHSFICLSDRDIPDVYCEPLATLPAIPKNQEGWWHKVSLFQPNRFYQGNRILYLDLDVVITGELDTLAKQWAPPPLTMIYNFGPNRHHAAHNSSVMLWTAGDIRLNKIWVEFNRDPQRVMTGLHGDQCWIWRCLRENIANFPQYLISSYKYDIRQKLDQPKSPVVVFHGSPKPHQCTEEWIRQNW